jgi:hypothetical protein
VLVSPLGEMSNGQRGLTRSTREKSQITNHKKNELEVEVEIEDEIELEFEEFGHFI